ncbi:MAG: alpha-L-fucosidase, partial [Candidatus Bathyarchaeia archaeon]
MSSKAKFTFPERLRWWIEARFGMFIHWGLYAIPARGEWVMYCERIPKSEYAKLARRFNPKRFNADEWVALAKEAGMRYMVLTTRHHDGFCLWDSQVSDFTSVKATPAKRDFIAEYVEACRRANMRIGFYYSL